MKRTAILVGLAVGLASLPAGAGPREDKLARDLAFKERVNQAIDNGLLWVLSRQRDDGSWPGYENRYPMGMTALSLLTVLKCDYPRKSAAVKKARRFLYRKYRDQKSGRLKTYSVALLMMALEEYSVERSEKIRVDERYGRPRTIRRVHLPKADYSWMAALARWLAGVQTKTAWRYPGGGVDHSNTQYALLGLAAARRCGIRLSRDVFLRAAKYLLDAQVADGPRVRRIVHLDQGEGYAERYLSTVYDRARGWGYVPGRPATGSMTTAGVSSLAICRSELLDWSGYPKTIGPRLERGIKDGLAWLNVHFAVDTNPGGGLGWHYYYLFGLERAGVLADVRFLGDHEWYREGAEYLLSRQAAAGWWPGRGEHRLLNTCFALLFLRRATVPVRVPKAVTPGPGAPTEKPAKLEK